jgi:hypothetical protein
MKTLPKERTKPALTIVLTLLLPACSMVSATPIDTGPNRIVGGCVSPDDGSLRLWTNSADKYHVWATGPATAFIDAKLDRDQLRVRALYNDQAPEAVGPYWFIGLHIDGVSVSQFADHNPTPSELISINGPYQFRSAAKIAISKRFAGVPNMNACPPYADYAGDNPNFRLNF